MRRRAFVPFPVLEVWIARTCAVSTTSAAWMPLPAACAGETPRRRLGSGSYPSRTWHRCACRRGDCRTLLPGTGAALQRRCGSALAVLSRQRGQGQKWPSEPQPLQHRAASVRHSAPSRRLCRHHTRFCAATGRWSRRAPLPCSPGWHPGDLLRPPVRQHGCRADDRWPDHSTSTRPARSGHSGICSDASIRGAT